MAKRPKSGATKSNKFSKRKKSSRKAAGAQNHGIIDDVLAVSGALFRHQKDSGASKLSALATALRNFGSDIADLPALRGYADAAASQLQDFASYVSRTSFEKIAQDASRFARKHPVTTLGLAVMLALGTAQAVGVPLRGRGSARRARPAATSLARGRSRGRRTLGAARGGGKSNGHAAIAG